MGMLLLPLGGHDEMAFGPWFFLFLKTAQMIFAEHWCTEMSGTYMLLYFV